MKEKYIELYQAVEASDVRRLKSLIAIGVNANLVDGRGYTPLHIAAEKGNVEISALLIKAGVNVNTMSTYHKAAFDLAMDGLIESKTNIDRNLNIIALMIINQLLRNETFNYNGGIGFISLQSMTESHFAKAYHALVKAANTDFGVAIDSNSMSPEYFKLIKSSTASLTEEQRGVYIADQAKILFGAHENKYRDLSIDLGCTLM